MTERATVAQVIQLGMENPSGTPVAATKLVASFNLDGGIKAENIPFRGGGRKYSSFVVPNKEWSEWKISGQATYGEIVYLLNSALVVTNAVADGATAKKWTFTPALASEDTVKTYTVEIGSSVRAQQFAYGLVTELGLKFSRSAGCEIDGTMLGLRITDGHTLSAGCAAIEATPTPITGPQLNFYVADSWAGLAGASAFARCLSAEWRITNRFSPLWVIGSANTSWVAHVETVPTVRLKVMVEADAAGMAFLTLMRNGTSKWATLKASGAEITTGLPYMLEIDGKYNVLNVSDFSDQDGVYAVEWELEAVYDPAGGIAKTYEVVVRNILAAL